MSSVSDLLVSFIIVAFVPEVCPLAEMREGSNVNKPGARVEQKPRRAICLSAACASGRQPKGGESGSRRGKVCE